MKNEKQKKICMVIAMRDFRDEEYFLPKSIFEQAGFAVETASDEKGMALGVFGGVVKVKNLVSEIKAQDFDALVFVGGPIHKIASDFTTAGKIVATTDGPESARKFASQIVEALSKP